MAKAKASATADGPSAEALITCLRQAADELERAHGLLDDCAVIRSAPGDDAECTLTRRIGLALKDAYELGQEAQELAEADAPEK